MDLVSRLKIFLEQNNIGVTQFADECKIPRPTASQLLAGRNKKVSDEIIGKIHSSYPSLSIVWLMFGEGDMSVGGNSVSSLSSSGNDRKIEAQSVNHGSGVNVNATGTDSDLQNKTTQFAKREEPRNFSVFANTNSVKSTDRSVSESEFSFAGIDSEMQIQREAHDEADNGLQEFAFTIFSDPDAMARRKAEENRSTTNDNEALTTQKPELEARKVVGIVVYYDDNTYETFAPENLPFGFLGGK